MAKSLSKQEQDARRRSPERSSLRRRRALWAAAVARRDRPGTAGAGKPKPRPKTIQAEYVQYLTLCYCLMVGLMVRLLILVNSPDGRFLGERLERYSIPTLWRFALGLRRVAIG